MLYYFLKSILIGLAIAAPVGPIGVLCIRESLTRGFRAGFSCGMGAAAADGTYGAIAAFSLVSLDRMVGGIGSWGAAIGGIFLLILAWRIGRSTPAPEAPPASGRDMARGFLTTFLLTLSNPATIISFLAIFAGLGITLADGMAGKAATVVGVFLGSALWWLFLAGLSARLQHRIGDRIMSRINLVSALIIAAMGVASLLSLIR
ncbi:LysE family translocator [Aestuariispira insulae]|uniref:Threonine/homoserine/homoserine lactone efflux protein n=1 Tax=Aestuariispira insulae TaxID=1461337 RepID=A0A3D9HPN3_9PROT|nr:LysE family transporter [Aestuariispira insulae]RED51473.1 threonine/homoserine/homoserine lactone efflux protein [Aestuariispira insulae]